MPECGTKVTNFPELARKLTTRFVTITPLSDSWDAQANRSCNRLSESLLAKDYDSPTKQILEAHVEKNLAALHGIRAISANEYWFAASVERFRNACIYEGFAG